MRQSDSVPVQCHVAPGEILGGKYLIDEFVSAGGMGAVYKATYTAINRAVAVKIVSPSHSGDLATIKRFDREAKAAGTIGHDNICEVLDVGECDDGAPFLVMPWLNGTSLGRLIGRESLSLKRIADIACQILSALQVAHDAQIVHRDLKPENIFITKMGDREDFVKILDFGISKIIDQKAAQEITQTGTVLGTSYYMAPEQAMGSKEIDHRIDIYAVGVILYEMLTGKRPFSGDSYNEIVFKIITAPFELPSKLNPTIPAEIEKIVLKAMSRDPLKRYESANQMRKAIEAAVPEGQAKQEPRAESAAFGAGSASTSIDSAERPIAKAPSTARTKIAVAIGISLLLLIAAVIWGSARMRDEQNEERPKPVLTPVKPTEAAAAHEATDAKSPASDTDKIELKAAVEPTIETPEIKAASAPAVEENKQIEQPPRERKARRAHKARRDVKGKTGTTFFDDNE